MSLAGVHITFAMAAFAGGPAALPLGAQTSQTMASAATSTISAPGAVGGLALLSISASAAIFYATGPKPDATNGPRRYYDPSFGREDIFVSAGDKFDWILA